MFTGVFMDKMVGFIKLYFPVFLLGAVFGKVIELSGFSKSIVSAVIAWSGASAPCSRSCWSARSSPTAACRLFVVVFAVYPFAAEMFRQGDIPKRLIPGTIALGRFTFTMDALPGTPQIQNIIPTTFFKTTLGGAVARHHRRGLHSRRGTGLSRVAPPAGRRRAKATDEGSHQRARAVRGRESCPIPGSPSAAGHRRRDEQRFHAARFPRVYGATHEITLAGMAKPLVTQVRRLRRSGRSKGR